MAKDRVGWWVYILIVMNLCVSVSNLDSCEFSCDGNNLNPINTTVRT